MFTLEGSEGSSELRGVLSELLGVSRGRSYAEFEREVNVRFRARAPTNPGGIGWSRQPCYHRILELLRIVATGVNFYMRGPYFWSYIYAMPPLDAVL